LEELGHLKCEHLEHNCLEELERQKDLEHLEYERLKELERQKELEHLEELRQKEIVHLDHEHLEEIQRQKEREHLEQESLKASKVVHVVPNDSMDINIKLGEIGSKPTIKVREPSPHRVYVPIVAHQS
jgi:superfamily II DNA helicase RecQ